jgi:hypothetical protein
MKAFKALVGAFAAAGEISSPCHGRARGSMTSPRG